MILETSFILDLWDEKAEAVRKAREIDARGEPIYLPTPVLYELWEGVARSERPRQEATKIQDFVSGHDILPFGDADAREAGRGDGQSSRTGLAHRGSKIPSPVNGNSAGTVPIAPMSGVWRSHQIATRRARRWHKTLAIRRAHVRSGYG